uniref:BCAS3 WD40 domain-containing protein n=1 Tax=Timema douglasi TaxID=61478 RepID=A0A7R8VIN4_TIMDO|nr:unnamed protein product [Timema douglasi]
MSAESPRKSIRHGGYIVPPQPVSDRSIIENVAGFINEVVPQSYGSVPQGESKEVITWARFEYGDINDPALYPDISDDHSETPPLLLVLGYGTGVQVWAIPASGESTEVLSWRQGVVRMLRILPTPTVTTTDSYSHKRPLIALCDGTGPGPQFCSLSFISLRTGDQVGLPQSTRMEQVANTVNSRFYDPGNSVPLEVTTLFWGTVKNVGGKC